MKKRSIGLKRLFAGFVFLLSADISLFDILPDFIGYILIISGLSVLSDIDWRASEAKSEAKKLLVLSCVKFVFSLYLPSLQKTNLLLVTFSLGILNLILIFPFIKGLFLSIDYTATRQGVMISTKKTSEISTLLLFYFVIKESFMVLPNIVSLFDPSETGNYTNTSFRIDFDALNNVLTVICFFAMIVFSILAIVKTGKYFLSLNKNKTLVESLYENYDKTVLSVVSRMTTKHTLANTSVLLSSVVFFADFYVDFIDVLPTVIGFLLVVIYAMYVTCKMKIKLGMLTISAALGFLSSLFSFAYRFYWQKQLGSAVEYAFSEKRFTFISGVLTGVLTLLTLVLLTFGISKVEKTLIGETSRTKDVLLVALSLILSAFNFILYVYPEKNPTFVFPNIIFAVFFVYFLFDRIKASKSEILGRNKN